MKIYDASLAGTVTTVSGSTSNLTGSFSGSFSGSYVGNGSGLFNIPASGVTGLELNKIVDGGTNATISATQGLRVNTNTTITGSLTVTGNLTAQQFIVSSSVTHLTTSFSSGSTKFGDTIDDTHQFTGSVFISGSQNITGSLIVGVGGVPELSVQQTGVILGNVITDIHRVTGSLNISGSVATTGAATFSSGLTSTGTISINTDETMLRLGNLLRWGFQRPSGGDNRYISFMSNMNTTAIPVFTLDGNNGNVGIGTTTPSALLHVRSSGSFGSIMADNSNAQGGGGFVARQNGSNRAVFGVSGYVEGNTSSDAAIYAETSGNIRFYTNGVFSSERMRITTTGNVGIGTSSPTNISGYRGLTINGTNGGFTYWNINDVDTGRIITDSANFYIDNVTTGATVFRTTSSSSERMRITTGGNVFVGGQNSLGLTLQRFTVTEDNAVSLLGIYRNSATTSQEQGGIQWMNGGSATNIARISVFTSSDFSDTGNIVFYTRASGQSQAERMRITSAGVVQPGANGTQDLGTSSLRWGTIYTSDLSLSNGIGDYTIVEGEEKLYLYNNKNNKVYSFVLQEEDPLTATPKKS
jgi:hypothetical protein